MATKDRTALKDEFKNGNLATGEKFADLIDSMKVVQLPVVDPQALGTSLSFIDSISQDADGKITATKKTLDLENAHELNPFKGWYKTGDTLPTDGFDGAYLYFKDTSELTGQTTIYRWNGTTYADTGTVVDTSNVQTFGSGQQVNAVKIKDENGEEVVGDAGVLSAEAGRDLYLQVNGGISKTLVDLNDVSIWQQGGINSSTGAEQSNTKRCRTVFLEPTSDSIFSLDPIGTIPYGTGTFYCYCYDENKVYLGWGSSGADKSITQTNNKISVAKLLEDFPTLKYVRIMFSYNDSSSDITPEYVLNRFTFADTFYNPQVQEGIVDEVSNIDNRLQEVEEIVVGSSETGLVLSGNSLVFTGSKGTISTVKKKTGAYYNDFNRNFNFMSASIGGISIENEDDIAPMHIMNSTFGANHAQPCGFATISGHGLGNEAVGTLWTHSNGYKYYIVRIINADKIAFLSENEGTETSPVYRALATGSVSNGNTTLTITEVDTKRQMWPGCGNESLKMYDNKGKEITDDGEYQAEWFDVVEEYDLWTPDSVVANLVANVGSSDIVYNGDAVVHWRNIYRFLPNNNVLCIVSNTFLKSCAFSNIMFAQSSIFTSAKTYIPNSLPNNGLDFRVPVHVNWSGSVSSFNAVVGNTSNPDVPVNRVLRYNGAVGFAIGFIPSYGVAKDLSDFTLITFEIRGDSGKIYPHGVESGVVGTTMPANKTYNAVMYRCFFDCNETSPRMSMYHFDYNGFEYVFVDYSTSIYDTVVIDDRLNGKPITVVEALNTVLDGDVYNSGFNVNANYVSGETCYIVVKIG